MILPPVAPSCRKPDSFHKRLKCISFAITLFAGCSLEAATFYYTFGGEDGGVAQLEVDESTGTMKAHQVIAANGLHLPKKLVVNAKRDRLLVTSDDSKKAWLFRLGETPEQIAEIDLQENASDVRVHGDYALVAVSKGLFHWIRMEDGQIEKTWNARESLRPSGRKGESILILPEQNLALVSFQKDSEKGKHKGSRIVAFDLESFAARHDLQLPRNRSDLHIAGDDREQGPNPEVVLVGEKTNTLAITLDLYGAVAFADYAAALDGEWKNLTYQNTSPEGKWGTAFPDRAKVIPVGEKEYLLVANASKDGGLMLFDLAKREAVQTFHAPAGSETPVHLKKSNKVLTVVSGKIKSRSAKGLNSRTAPGKNLLVFDFNPASEGKPVTLNEVPFVAPLFRVEAVNPNGNDLVLLAQDPAKTEWVIYDVAQRKTLHRFPAHGPVSRIAVVYDEP